MRVNAHRRKRIDGVPKVPRTDETGREPDEQRSQYAHHHHQTDHVAQRYDRNFWIFFIGACNET